MRIVKKSSWHNDFEPCFRDNQNEGGLPMFKNLRQDLKTYSGDWSRQGFWVMIVYRFGRWRYTIKPSLLRKPFSLLYKILYKFIQVITGIELPCEVKLGKNFRIDHFGGIIISGFASFGDNCVIRDGVTVGLRRVDDPVAPKIGNNVDIGTGAKVLGEITVGDNVVIGANAVVLDNIPPNSIAVGVPARIVPPKKDEEHAA
jgi:serine O-acetyltransferase